jgi:Ca2+-transporting ATPase
MALRWSNVSLRWVLVAVVVMLGVTLWWPLARAVFRFGPLHADDLAVTAAGGVLVLGLLEGVKALRRSTPGASPRGA